MTTKHDGGPAFPRPSSNFNRISLGYEAAQDGMTLRDWFAGMVLPNMVNQFPGNDQAAVTEAYRIADAMLAERDKHI